MDKQIFAVTNNVIESLLDTDLYKFTMMQVVFEKYTNTHVRYRFKSRNAHILNNVDRNEFILAVKREIAHLCTLRLTDSEIEYLSTIRFFKPGFIEFLRMFKLNSRYISVYVDAKTNDIAIDVEGPWLFTILFEVPILAIVSELYSCMRYDNSAPSERDSHIKISLNTKICKILDFNAEFKNKIAIADMGTRRRYSFNNQDYVLKLMSDANILAGTSNVYFAKHLGIRAIGTMAHEYICAHQQLGRVADCQKAAFQAWAEVYRGDLGIALSDTVGFDAFLRDFDLYFAKLFDGCRHDSGDPYEWGEKLIAHYEKFGIDPRTKIAVFSDGLDVDTMYFIFKRFSNRIKVSFGIGTNLTNDVGVPALQIVMKMTECNGRPVAKISDSPGKGMCDDPMFVEYIKSIFGGAR